MIAKKGVSEKCPLNLEIIKGKGYKGGKDEKLALFYIWPDKGGEFQKLLYSLKLWV